jgi:ComF family protein
MLSQVKYHLNRQLLDYPCLDFANRTVGIVRQWQAEALIPVPVHRSRLRERGYNQAAEIAKRLSEVWEIPVDDRYLLRTEKTAAQKTLGDSARFMNLLNAFAVPEEAGRYRTVILVDDIYTTGTTVDTLAGVLLAGGARKVWSASVSIAPGRS